MTAPKVVSLQTTWDGRMLALIRRTVATDCNENEFELFVHAARHLRLDPLRRQIYAFVFNKDDAKKRRMSIVTSIDGLRTIAARTEDYRPDDEEPSIEYDESAKDAATNPYGIVKAVVRCYRHSHGGWHRVVGSAHWSEFAPIKDEWAWDNEQGKRAPTGKKTLDGKWGQMGRLMLCKVAEAQALRKAWPDDLSSVYVDEEMDRAKVIDLSATELIEHAAAEDRQARIGGPGLMVDWLDANKPLEKVPLGRFADRVLEFINENADQPAAIKMFTERNRDSLREFWAHSPGDALELKKRTEEALSKAGLKP